ncbi:PREDICTED: probable multidrug resistance-associated protein lethal(2)03659 [Wasmannia auropunctata]|uniref:probable multidrug resistance-associated protein lethal(2)03659 n=1 Tax=Wasmannia auropunctata TaxID=64793 RepID=UPI0005EE0893|nr:PREDICTED: probable multidrug resistance-associated protein lethal(2)03659 [Wasmannia auropunctata]
MVGAVGSGKSSVLHLLLKELDLGGGFVILSQGSSSQEPWIFNGTVRENILFGEPYDKARYMQVSI